MNEPFFGAQAFEPLGDRGVMHANHDCRTVV
jgi:hypothetical protein